MLPFTHLSDRNEFKQLDIFPEKIFMRPENLTGNEYNLPNSFPRLRNISFKGPGSYVWDEKAFIRGEILLTVPKLIDIPEYNSQSILYHCSNYRGGVQAFMTKFGIGIGVRICRIKDVAGDSPVYGSNMLDYIIPIFKEEIILRAEAMKGVADYNLFSNNGQHFRTKNGIAFSREAEMLLYWTFYSNKMVHQVALAGCLEPLLISRLDTHIEIFEFSVKGNFDESKIQHMIDIRTITGSEIQPHNALFLNATLTSSNGYESQLLIDSDESGGFNPANFFSFIQVIIVGMWLICTELSNWLSNRRRQFFMHL